MALYKLQVRDEAELDPSASDMVLLFKPQYIISELDEMDREEFFRLKKVQGKKKRNAEIEDAQRALAKERAAAEGEDGGAAGGGGDILGAGKDEDVIF